MKKVAFLLTALAVFALIGCGGGGSTGDDSGSHSGSTASSDDTPQPDAMAAINLAEKHNIPVTVMAPAGAEVKKGMGMAEFDGIKTWNWEIKKDKFLLSVTMDDDEPWQEEAEYLADAKESAQETDGFVGFVKEDPKGFIYKYDDDGVGFGLYYILTKGNRVIEFEEGFSFSEFTQAEAEKMYEAAMSAK